MPAYRPIAEPPEGWVENQRRLHADLYEQGLRDGGNCRECKTRWLVAGCFFGWCVGVIMCLAAAGGLP